jgi:hypothetical protein
VFECISVVVEESVCVRDCRGLALCKISIVGWSVGDECEGGEIVKCQVREEWEGKVRTGEKSGGEGAE